MNCSVGDSSIQFECGVFRKATLLVSGTLIYVFADPVSQTSRAVPLALRECFTAFEAEQAMVSVRLGGWSDLESDLRQVRTQVFIEEQGVPKEMEWDSIDADAIHAVAVNALGMPLGTGRAFFDTSGAFRIGRMAVVASMRGNGVGRQLLEKLMHAGRSKGAKTVGLSAQTSAVAFYLRAGFQTLGDEYDDAGIPHIEMTRVLAPPT